MKKILGLLFVSTLVIGMCGCGSTKATDNSASTKATTEADTTEYIEATTEADVSKSNNNFKPKGDSKTIDFDITFEDNFRNDTTGKWRKAMYAESNEFQDYALNYYDEYFQDDSEVHVVYNFTTNAVYCITNVSGMLSVNVTEYVKGEEHDAKLACSGTHLATYMVYLDNGVVEKF